MTCVNRTRLDASADAVGAAAVEPDTGMPGASAEREFQRRHDKREADVRAAHPRLGRLILALTDDPATTAAWAKGAEGERRVAARLALLADLDVIVLHDRRIPGSRANIDHVVVGPSGVFVIDTKRYTGRVTSEITGSIWNPGPVRLYVGRRDCTKLIDGVARQVTAVEQALSGESPAMPTTPMLCFVEAERSWFARPFVIDGVWIGSAEAIGEVVSAPGPFNSEQISHTGRKLAERLRPA
jgi:hypothetical protein